ncbi:SUGAR-INSENSITIVE 3 [Artemisia annua]|uniref:SUGAR-INSENSITIVE 3 n=1 Tax=Artemisia annua TaxID=35608 RepID=A0A2U1P6E4_ARTAN|nr:SUGAR-INSENSITIVE 3 [Artemisia annua]
MNQKKVRGLPCAHNFHVACIDEWLRLNVKCPRCRCSVFPNLDLSALSTIPADPDRLTVSTTRYMRTQPSSQSYLLRMQGFLRPIRTGNSGSISDSDTALETMENGGQASENHDIQTNTEPER